MLMQRSQALSVSAFNRARGLGFRVGGVRILEVWARGPESLVLAQVHVLEVFNPELKFSALP